MIVSDEPILDTQEKIMRTNRQLCLVFPEEVDLLLDDYRNWKKGTLENVLYENLISQQTSCCINDFANRMSELLEKPFFMYTADYLILTYLKVFNRLIRKEIFVNYKPYFSSRLVHYISKSTNRRIKIEFNRQVLIYAENGHSKKAFRQFNEIIDQQFPPVKKTFRNAREYTEHYTTISNVQMSDFTFVYLFYLVWSITLFVFVLHKLTRPTFPPLQWPLNETKILMKLKSALHIHPNSIDCTEEIG